ncbi:MAG: hypothetical protein ACE144_04420, partial [Thermodesulfobacteriota bacterium]
PEDICARGLQIISTKNLTISYTFSFTYIKNYFFVLLRRLDFMEENLLEESLHLSKEAVKFSG